MTSSRPRPTLAARLRQAWAERAVALKAASFAMVGVVNSVVDFSVFSVAYYYFGLSIIVANVVSWIVAVSGSYVMNSMTTFAAESGRSLRLPAYLTFAFSQVAGLLANTATVLAASFLMPVVVAKLLAIGVSFLVNFSLSNFVVFRRQTGSSAGGHDVSR